MKWVTASFLFIIVASFCFVLFIVFNWVLYNVDTGIFSILDGFANRFFNRSYLDWWDGINSNIAFGFGLSGVVCLFLAIVCYIADVFSGDRRINA